MRILTSSVILYCVIVLVQSGSKIHSTKQDAKVNCPPYFQENTGVPCWTLGSKCYCFSNFRMTTWMRCDAYCREGNFTLVGIETPEEDKLINDHVQANPVLNYREYWTSGRYSQEGNDRWEWASQEPFQPMNYTNWHLEYNQPNDNEPGSCALMYFLDTSGYWADNVCIYGVPTTAFICESP